jgi:hypothetical protein
MPFGIYNPSPTGPFTPGDPVSVGDTGGVRTADYGKCGSSASGRNYSVNYELGRVPNTLNSSFANLANLSTLMNPAPPTLANAQSSLFGYLGVRGWYMSYWFNRRGRTQGFNFSVSFSPTSYGKYGNDQCTGGASASVSSGPYQTNPPESFTINLAGSVATGTSSASVSQTGRCAGNSTSWSVTNNFTGCTYSGTGATSWSYTTNMPS